MVTHYKILVAKVFKVKNIGLIIDYSSNVLK